MAPLNANIAVVTLATSVAPGGGKRVSLGDRCSPSIILVAVVSVIAVCIESEMCLIGKHRQVFYL